MVNDSANFEARSGDVGVERGNAAPIPDIGAEGQAARTAGGGEIIGRVAAPPQLESTPEHFHFWVERDRLVETNQFVRTESTVGGQAVQFFGVIDEVRRSSRKRDILEEYDVADGDALFEPPFKPEGVTYARASVLRTTPDIFTPALEQSVVRLGGEEEARFAYGFTEMKRALAVGLLRNGARATAGPALIDLAYLLGEQGGHLNVNGMAGVAAKSSFLLTVVKLLLQAAQQPQSGASTQQAGKGSSTRAADPLYIVPIVLNVKGEDLMWINKRNREFDADRQRNEGDWRALGIPSPGPFTEAEFFCPPDPKSEGHAPSVAGCDAKSYFWSPRDVFEAEAFRFLFSDDDTSSPVMMACVYDIIARMTDASGRLRGDAPQTWAELLEWLRKKPEDEADRMHSTGTWRAVYRRLFDILSEGRGIFPPDAQDGRPLKVTRTQTSPPQVVDIHSLPASLQRFVVAMIVKQVVEARTGRGATSHLRYLIVLDELNRFAPRGGTDPITRLLERVATEMRSQGVILFGAQQMASQVSTKIIEMSSIRVLGRTGPAELQDRVWQSLDKPTRQQASVLSIEQKLVMQPTFRKPMLVRVPHPAWAMKYEHIAASTRGRPRNV
jgi:hypothetical protein